MSEYVNNLEKIKKLISSQNLQDATDADGYMEKLSVSEMKALFDYCYQMFEITGDRNFKFAIDRIRKTASSKREENNIYVSDPVTNYLQDILNSSKMYPIARRPGHPDGENQNTPDVTTG